MYLKRKINTKLIDGKVGVEGNIRTFPYYLVFLLRDYLKR